MFIQVFIPTGVVGKLLVELRKFLAVVYIFDINRFSVAATNPAMFFTDIFSRISGKPS